MFTEDQKKFIVKAFGRNPSPTKVKKEFLREFQIAKGRASTDYKLYQFSRVNKEFEKRGSVHSKQRIRPKTKRTEEKKEEVESFFAEQPSFSLRQAAPNLSISVSTLRNILKFDLNKKFYHITSVQRLQEPHKEQRRQFCQWLLNQDEELVQRVIWTDEKMFVLNQKPHRKNDGCWSAENPREIVECNDRNDKKVMIFVAIVNGKIPIVHEFIDDEGQRVSVDSSCYLALLQEKVWPTFRATATRNRLWWMQDGAPPHCTREVKQFLIEKFHGRVISRGTEIIWPAHSPDLNPLDFHFWAAAQKMVYEEKPQSIQDLVNCVKHFSANYDTTTIEKVTKNVLKRARLCLEAGGGHFQHLL